MSEVRQLGFIGLGNMGAPMAERLFSPDIRLHIYDPSPQAVAPFVEAGAVSHPSPRQVAEEASIVMSCLPSRQVSEEVALGQNGVIHGKAVRIYVEMSTIGRTCVDRISSELAKNGIRTVDGPVSGGPPAARAGRLAMMVSGDPDAVACVTPWLARIGHKVYPLGDRPGQAQIMKLVNNLVMAANMIVASEGLVMGGKAGLDPERMIEILRASTGHSVSADILAKSALTGAFDFGAHLSIVEKDVMLGIEEAHALDVPVPVIEEMAKIWRAASAEGLSRDDFTSVIRIVEGRGGTLVRNRS